MQVAGTRCWSGKQTAMREFQHCANVRRTVTEPEKIPLLELLNRHGVPTEQAAYCLLRRPQTLRGWACAESFPHGLRPVRRPYSFELACRWYSCRIEGTGIDVAINRLLLRAWWAMPSLWLRKKGGR